MDQVSLKSIEAYVYSIPKTTGLTMLTNRVNNVKSSMTSSDPYMIFDPITMCNYPSIIVPKFHENPSKYVDAVTKNAYLDY